MGWMNKKNQIIIDIGEIPNKKQITDQELANMRANAPDRDLHEQVELQTARHKAILDSIVQSGQGELLEFINYYCDCNEIDVKDIFNGTIKTNILNFMIQEKINHDINDVMDVFYKKCLMPPMFYFGIKLDSSMSNGFYINIAPIPVWQEKKCLDNQKLEDYTTPDWLVRIADGKYEVIENKTPAATRRELLNLGFIENHEIA